MSQFRFFTPTLDPAITLCVDGVVDGYRCLSHWPGNDTPEALKHDLSTGIVLAWAKLAPAERAALTGSFDVVTNHHYDTDGVLSAFVALRPEEALSREDALLAAAATGDFGVWRGPDALAIELTVMALSRPDDPRSPLHGALSSVSSNSERWEQAYRWLIDELPDLLDAPDRLAFLWEDRHEAVAREIAALGQGGDAAVEHHADLDLAVVTRTAPITKYGLHALAADRSRVLLVTPDAGGWRYRFLFRVESWFDLARPSPPPRISLTAAMQTLQAHETSKAGTWWATPLDTPVAAAGFGAASRASEVFFDDPDVANDAISAIEPAQVVDVLADALAG